MKRWMLVALLLLAGCSNKPQQVEVIIKSDKPEMTAEQKSEEARLKTINDLKGPAVTAYGELVDKQLATKGKERDRSLAALMAFDEERHRLDADTTPEGQLKAAQFFHSEVVGKSFEEFVSKWAPRTK